jgi:DnaJ-class molecular chaperone
MATNVKDYYKVLGVTRDASFDEIKIAFRQQAMRYSDGNDPNARALKEAFDILTDPKKRKQYDRYLDKETARAIKENPLQAWEYLTLQSSKNYGVIKYYINGRQEPKLKNALFANVINMFGAEGWELVGIASDAGQQTFVFKRPTDEPPAQQEKIAPA